MNIPSAFASGFLGTLALSYTFLQSADDNRKLLQQNLKKIKRELNTINGNISSDLAQSDSISSRNTNTLSRKVISHISEVSAEVHRLLEGYKAQWNQKVYDFAQYVNKL